MLKIIWVLSVCLISLLWLTGCGAPASSTYEPSTNLSEPAVSSAASTLIIPAETALASSPAASLTTARTPAASPEKTTEGRFKDVVIQADYIVTGTITDLKFEIVKRGTGKHAGTFTYTIYTLEVEKVIKGETGISPLMIKTEGGLSDDNKTGLVEHQEVFSIPSEVLLCLEKDASDDTYLIMSKGPVWVNSKTRISGIDQEVVIAWLILDMKANNIPVTLPHEDYPPLPTSTTFPYSQK